MMIAAVSRCGRWLVRYLPNRSLDTAGIASYHVTIISSVDIHYLVLPSAMIDLLFLRDNVQLHTSVVMVTAKHFPCENYCNHW